MDFNTIGSLTYFFLLLLFVCITEAAVSKEKIKTIILEKGQAGACLGVHKISTPTNYIYNSNYIKYL